MPRLECLPVDSRTAPLSWLCNRAETVQSPGSSSTCRPIRNMHALYAHVRMRIQMHRRTNKQKYIHTYILVHGSTHILVRNGYRLVKAVQPRNRYHPSIHPSIHPSSIHHPSLIIHDPSSIIHYPCMIHHRCLGPKFVQAGDQPPGGVCVHHLL